MLVGRGDETVIDWLAAGFLVGEGFGCVQVVVV